jgi:phenylalanyl-tRNA synthetase alpha chain
VSATLEEVLAQPLQEIEEAKNLDSLDQIRVRYLGKKGQFTLQMKELGSLDPEQRRSVGQIINQAKDQFQQKLESRKIVL